MKKIGVFLVGMLFGVSVFGQGEFITKWTTTSPSEQIVIGLNQSYSTYNYTVNWGDGATESNITSNTDKIHTYATAGTYTVTISGDFPAIKMQNSNTASALTDIVQWGSNIVWKDMINAFKACDGLNTISAADAPNLSGVTRLQGIFNDCDNVVIDNLGQWDVSNITNMLASFYRCNLGDVDLSSWNVSNVTTFKNAFNASSWTGNGAGNWDVTSVTTAENMFAGANLSTTNYDALLQGWAGQSGLQLNVIFHAGSSSTYCNASSEKQLLETTHGWIITDGGQDCTAGVEDMGVVVNTIEFYPNPIKNNLHIEGLNPGLPIVIYDVLGAQVFSAQTSEDPIDLSELRGGVYFLQITIDNSTSTHKIVKE